jgi:hypothetical protein
MFSAAPDTGAAASPPMRKTRQRHKRTRPGARPTGDPCSTLRTRPPRTTDGGHTPRRRTPRAVAVTATTAALITSGFLTGAGNASAAGSADAGSSYTDTAVTRSATTTYANLSITREIIGNNVGVVGNTVRYRTTISAVDGPAREITAFRDRTTDREFARHPMLSRNATVTYTDPSGSVVTDEIGAYANGSWPVDAATGATVVYDATSEFKDPAVGGSAWIGPTIPSENFDNWLVMDVTGLDTLRWMGSGVTATCLFGCASSPWGLLDWMS